MVVKNLSPIWYKIQNIYCAICIVIYVFVCTTSEKKTGVVGEYCMMVEKKIMDDDDVHVAVGGATAMIA